MKNTEDLTPEEKALEDSLSHLKPEEVPEALLSELQNRLEKHASPTLDSSYTQGNLTDLSPRSSTVVSLKTFLWTIAAILMIGFYLGVGVGRAGMELSMEPTSVASKPVNQPVIDDLKTPAIHVSKPNSEDAVLRNRKLKHIQDDGVVLSVGHTPMKRLRYEFVDTYFWKPSENGSLMRMEVPREDFVLVPVSTY